MQMTREEKEIRHRRNIAEAQTYLETLMGEAGLPEESKQRLRRAFPGTDKGGMRTAVTIEKRMVVTK
jgi:hypothetical protein